MININQKKQIIIALIFATILQGCSLISSENLSKSDTKNSPLPPIFESSRVIEVEGEKGIWINEEDTAELLLWLHELENK